MISSQESVTGKPLTEEQKRLLNEKQKGQLEELERATTDLGQPS